MVNTRKKFGKVEFLALKEEISELERQGYPRTEIHSMLFNAGKLTIGYRSLCRHLGKIVKEKQVLPPEETPQCTAPLPATVQEINANKPKGNVIIGTDTSLKKQASDPDSKSDF